jgi:hypothetical protein
MLCRLSRKVGGYATNKKKKKEFCFAWHGLDFSECMSFLVHKYCPILTR